MAAHRKRKHNRRHSAGTTSHRRRNSARMNRAPHRCRRHNPSSGTFGSPKDWLFGGLGVVVGATGARALPQIIMPSSNTGPMGYFLNAASTAILAMLSHMTKLSRLLTGGIIAGGAGSIISRIIGDYSLLGSYSSQVYGASGLGDYQFSDFLTPQRLVNGTQSAALAQPSWAQPAPIIVSGQSAAAAGGVGSLYGRPLY